MSLHAFATERRPASGWASATDRSGFLQRRPAEASRGSVSVPGAEDVVRSSGKPLDRGTRSFMESRFGHDFGRVRVHTDARAAESARAVNAHAYTVGHDIVFADGRFDPSARAGRRLLAHELTHVVQQRPVLARQIGEDPAYRAGLDRALARGARLPERAPHPPTISPPPRIAEDQPCTRRPDDAAIRAGIRRSGIAARTEAYMATVIATSRARSAGNVVPFTPAMLRQADRAIRQEFGTLLPASRALTAPGEATTVTPDAFAAARVPEEAAARERIGDAALRASENAADGDVLRDLCVTDAGDAVLQSEVAAPILKKKAVSFVREYVKAHMGGVTTFPTINGVRRPHVEVPSESRNLGHIVMHEAMHYYVSPAYQAAAEASSTLRLPLMEGGAEYLARQVISARLAKDPAFAINPGTYAGYRGYVASYLLRGGLGTFALAYFAGRIDLLGLTRAAPKLAMSVPGDPYEQEADRMAEAVAG